MRLRLLFATVLALASAACSRSPKPVPIDVHGSAEMTRSYDFLMGAGRAGGELVTRRGDQLSVHFEFNDRGRGPKTDSVIVVDSRSIPISISTTGNDYFKATVKEEFANGSWRSDAEKGHS